MEPNGYRSDGGYKSDGYKSDGEGYKSDRDGYKSDGGGYRSDGERIKQRRNRYNSPSRKPTKYAPTTSPPPPPAVRTSTKQAFGSVEIFPHISATGIDNVIPFNSQRSLTTSSEQSQPHGK